MMMFWVLCGWQDDICNGISTACSSGSVSYKLAIIIWILDDSYQQ